MNNRRNVLRSILLSGVLGLSALSVGHAVRAEEVFVDDLGDNTVKRFDAERGTFLGSFVSSGSGGLNGPMGLVFRGRKLVVVNQNFGSNNGEILLFDGMTGAFDKKLVAASDPNPPFAPRGIVRGPGNTFYVADVGTSGNTCTSQGRVARYDGSTGAFVDDLDRHAFTPEFHPRGLVFGPDGLLYVSAIGCPIPTDPLFNPLTGYVLRFDPRTKAFVDVFASNTTVPDLHRPEGLVFDKKGNLWITSFRADANHSDTILKLNGKTGVLLDEIVLAPPVASGGKRAFAQAIIFGPGGDLFVPINGNDPTTQGELRRCHPSTKVCKIIVPSNSAGGALQQPGYLIFRDTDPATLDYEDE